MPTAETELAIPDGAVESGASEMARVWVGSGRSHVGLRTGMYEPDSEPGVWGLVLADIAEEAIRSLVPDARRSRDIEAVRKQIEKTFKVRLRRSLAAMEAEARRAGA